MSLSRSLGDVSILNLRRRISVLKRTDFKNLSDDATAYQIGRVIDQYPFQLRSLQLTGLYRARANRPGEIFSSASQLWYPPAESIVRPSRLNRVGDVRFYASNMPNAAMLELRSQSGDMFTILIARTRSGSVETLNVAFVGLERALAPELRNLTPEDSFRTASHFREVLGPVNYEKWLLIDDYLSKIFGALVPEGEEYNYRPTIALADLLFRAPNLDAVNYPSVATGNHGINVCMLPSKADQLFVPAEAWMVEVSERAVDRQTGEMLWRVHFRRRSSEIRADGGIVWRPPGDGIDESEILRFTRGRLQSLNEWPMSIEK